MKFYNREKEILRLQKALRSEHGQLIIIYGRRRCGKSSLIKHVLRPGDIYYMAQVSDEAVQRMQLAKAIGEIIPGFDRIIYPDWESLFTNLDNTAGKMLTLCIDEMPYIVRSSPGFPSLIQKIIDNSANRKYHLILCGSSQQMMHGMVLDSTSPLYGRANEIFRITPLEPGWLTDALDCSHLQAVVEYSVWGGVPRYWELRQNEETFESAVKNIIFDRLGILHEEPARLFLDDMRESTQAFSILSVVGNGCNRLSEIAGRLNKPATQLSRPIENLIKLGYLTREKPFGESGKSGKKSLYRISDPFMNFYFTFIVPNLSRLEMGLNDKVYSSFEKRISTYVSREWENLCRRCISMKPIQGIDFDLSSRWWGNNTKGNLMEMDVIALSADKKYLLAGECKWTEINDIESLIRQIEEKAGLLPFSQGRQIIPVAFIKDVTDSKDLKNVFLPSDVMERLR